MRYNQCAGKGSLVQYNAYKLYQLWAGHLLIGIELETPTTHQL